jgi:hypothetical protein
VFQCGHHVRHRTIPHLPRGAYRSGRSYAESVVDPRRRTRPHPRLGLPSAPDRDLHREWCRLHHRLPQSLQSGNGPVGGLVAVVVRDA